MKIHHLSEKNSVLNHFLSQIRSVSVQEDRMRFRKNIERIGEIMAYEISKTLSYKPEIITTPLGQKKTNSIDGALVVCSILRAALPMHTGFLNFFDWADNGFISAFRHHPTSDSEFEIVVQYQAISEIEGKTILLVDPMLATGQSIVAVYNELIKKGTPAAVHIAVVIAAPEGIAYLQTHLPENCQLWIASIDEKLNDTNYIIPGLGDAGDLAFGTKL